MPGIGDKPFARRDFLVGTALVGSIALGALALPGIAFAQDAADADTEAVRRLMVLSSNKALTKLGQPNGFLTSTVARIGLPALFKPKGTQPGPLAEVAFREQLIQRLNSLAEAGARGATPAVAEAARKLPITNAPLILRGKGPTAATSAMRLEMGSGLVNALWQPLEQALTTAQDPIVAQAIAALPGVTLHDVAHAVALAADNGIWYEIGSAEAEIRANPQATGDAALIAALTAVPAAPAPAPAMVPTPTASPAPHP